MIFKGPIGSGGASLFEGASVFLGDARRKSNFKKNNEIIRSYELL